MELVTGLVICEDPANLPWVTGRVARSIDNSPSQSAKFLSLCITELVTDLLICEDSANLPRVTDRVAVSIDKFTKPVSKIPKPY